MKILAALLAAVSITTSAIAQPAPTGPTEYTLRLHSDDVNWIGRALDELPAKVANPITKRLVDQITIQNEAFRKAQQPVDAKPADANANPAEPPK